jgi:hypothetical protein
MNPSLGLKQDPIFRKTLNGIVYVEFPRDIYTLPYAVSIPGLGFVFKLSPANQSSGKDWRNWGTYFKSSFEDGIAS